MQTLSRPLIGKARQRLKAIKANFTPERVLLPTENLEDFRLLREHYFAHCGPKNYFEELMVDDITVAKWRYLRVVRVRAALLDLDIAERDFALAYDPVYAEETTNIIDCYSRLAGSIKIQLTAAIRRFSEERR